jgi:hypothetical protein
VAITLTNGDLRDYTEYAGHPRPADGKLHLLGMRSCVRYPAGEGKVAISLIEPRPGEYDDQVGFFGSDLALFAGTVDPGRFFSQHPQRPAGCAHLVGLDEDGGRPYRYRRGLHRRRGAFVQGDEVVVIWRDRDRDMVQDEGEDPHEERGNGVNVHRMGTLRADVGKWSAGCLGVMDRHWPEFWTRSAERHPQPEYWLYLLDAWRFAKWFDNERTA